MSDKILRKLGVYARLDVHRYIEPTKIDAITKPISEETRASSILKDLLREKKE